MWALSTGVVAVEVSAVAAYQATQRSSSSGGGGGGGGGSGGGGGVRGERGAGGSRWTSAHPLETGTSVGVHGGSISNPVRFSNPVPNSNACSPRPDGQPVVRGSTANTESETRQVSHHGDSIPEPTVTSGVDRHKRFSPSRFRA